MLESVVVIAGIAVILYVVKKRSKSKNSDTQSGGRDSGLPKYSRK